MRQKSTKYVEVGLDNTVVQYKDRKYTCLYLITLAYDRYAQEVDSVHVQGDRDDVQGQCGVGHAGDGASP